MNRSERAFALVVTTATFVVGLAVAFRHEWWRDEANTWLIVRANHGLGGLISTIGFNGHPKPYYVLVWLLSRVSSSPLALSVVNLACATGAIGLFAAVSPFSRLQRALFAFGFFPLYQYGIIVRSYAAFLLLLFAYAALQHSAPERRATRFLVLALLAQVHAMATLGAAALFGIELITSDPRRWSRAAILGALAVVLSGLAAVWQLIPPNQHYLAANVGPPLYYCFANAFLPLFGPLTWGPVHLRLGLALFAMAWFALAANRGAVARFALLSATLLAVGHFAYVGFRWHHGWYFIYFIVSIWLCGGQLGRLGSAYVTALFALHAGIGLYALNADFRGPYSDGHAIAAAIRTGRFDKMPLVGVHLEKRTFNWDIDEIQPVLLDLEDGQAYDPIAGTYERFWRHYDDAHYFPIFRRSRMTTELATLAARLESAVLVVVVLPGPAATFRAPAPLQLVSAPPPGLDFGEHLALYVYPAPVR